MTLAENLFTQLNDPNCSYLTGMYLGGITVYKIIFSMVIAYFIFKAVDKLAFEPLLNYCKLKINKLYEFVKTINTRAK
jgi:hypothetical protein